MYQIRDMLIPKGAKRRSGKKLLEKNGVTVHNVGNHNKGANADANARYYNNSKNESVTGVHFFVDDKEIVRIVPQDEIVEHTGKRAGNDTTVCIEICDHSDGNIRMATDQAAELAAKLLKDMGYKNAVWKQNIFQHNDWSGKNCPEDLRQGKPYSWAEFVEKVNGFMAGGGSRMYVTTRTAEIYRRDSPRLTIGAGNELELLEFSGGKWAQVKNPATGNEFIVEFAALKQK